STGWALNRFFSNHQLNELLAICLENEPSDSIRKSLVDDAIYLLQIEGSGNTYWDKLKEIAGKNNISNEVLKSITDFYAQQKTEVKSPEDLSDNKQNQECKQDW